MRFFLGLAITSLSLLLLACNSDDSNGSLPSAGTHPNAGSGASTGESPSACRTATSSCSAFATWPADAPAREGALLWSWDFGTSVQEVLSHTRAYLVVSADGVLRRSPVLRDQQMIDVPPHGVINVRLSQTTLDAMQIDVMAFEAEAPAAFVRATDPPAIVVGTHAASTCWAQDVGHGLNGAEPFTPACMQTGSRRLRNRIDQLFQASEAAWRAAKTGNVSLDRELRIAPWPSGVDESIVAKDGSLPYSKEQIAIFGHDNVDAYRLSDGTFVHLEHYSDIDGDLRFYVDRWPAVVLDGALADLAVPLLDTRGNYVASKGTALGLPLDAERFPAFKNHQAAVFPATNGGPERVYFLYAIESFDLSSAPPI